MKNMLNVSKKIIILALIGAGWLYAQDTTHTVKRGGHPKQYFIDNDGDGYNDAAPDHDGDGIPNGLDADWQKQKSGKGKGNVNTRRFVDLNGDGLDDNLQSGEIETNPNERQRQNADGSSIEQKTQQKKRHGQNKQGNKR
jgi:hypothetical protein